MEFQSKKGSPKHLGVHQLDTGINFAICSSCASHISLCLFSEGSDAPFYEAALNRSGDIWHLHLSGLPERFEYAYRIQSAAYPQGQLVCDPYAKALNTAHIWGVPQTSFHSGMLRGRHFPVPPFDWQGDQKPNIPLEELIIYEMHVRAFTQDPSSLTKHPGTYKGVIEKIPYLKSLGVNAVELLPIHEFNECEYDKPHPVKKSQLCNFWGYSTVNFFTPMQRYATHEGWEAPILEFKEMVKAFHEAGMEVILDVVYNHTAEGNEHGPVQSFRGIDASAYYMLTDQGEYMNYSGCGNTVNCNHPTTQALIVDSLRYWVEEMHVDGFRFDLASILTRGPDGAPLDTPPVVHAITHDPILSKVKLIAEAWDCGGLYQVGSFPGEGIWAEWNGAYRDTIRRFIKGADGQAEVFADALLGSHSIYHNYSSPAYSINFVTAHDGFSMRDLVTYNEKHNFENGEDNRDGNDHNDSWNCGEEGPSTNPEVLELRERQLRNLAIAQFLSLGTPMMLMGDEYGHTRMGNNNVWCQDSALNWFQWNDAKENTELRNFFTTLIQIRKEHPVFKRDSFLSEADIEWLFHPTPEVQTIAYILKGLPPLLIAFNASKRPAIIDLPPNSEWKCLIETAKIQVLKDKVVLEPYSALVATS